MPRKAEAEKQRKANYYWNQYAVYDSRNGFMLHMSFSEALFYRSYAISYSDESGIYTISASSAKIKHGSAIDGPDYSAMAFFNDEISLSSIRKGSQHHILLAAPHMHLSSERIGAKADIKLSEDAECMTGTMGKIGDGFWSASKNSGSMSATGTIFIDHRMKSINTQHGSFSGGAARLPHGHKWQTAFISGEEWTAVLSSDEDESNVLSYSGKLYPLGHAEFRENSITAADGSISIDISEPASSESRSPRYSHRTGLCSVSISIGSIRLSFADAYSCIESRSI